MRCDICYHFTNGISSLTHHKKIHYTPEKIFDCTKCGKRFRNKCQLHQHYQTPSIKKWRRLNALFVKNVFRKNKILGSIMIISIKTSKGSLVNRVVKSLGKSARSAWRCEIFKEPYPHPRALKGHIKWVHKTKPSNIFLFYFGNNVQNKIYLSQAYK